MNGYLQRIALSAVKPGGSIQPVLGSVFSPAQIASGPEALFMETALPVARGASSKSVPRADPQPSVDDRGVRPLQDPEPEHGGQQSANIIHNPVPNSIRFFTPLLPCLEAKADALGVPSHPARSGDQQERGPLNARHETAAGPPPKQIVHARGVEMAPGQSVASQDFRKVVASTASPLTFGANAKERTGSRRTEPARREPDEIQIHIGRIEVTAVQAAAPAAAVSKPRKSAPSLDEYLSRRDRRAL